MLKDYDDDDDDIIFFNAGLLKSCQEFCAEHGAKSEQSLELPFPSSVQRVLAEQGRVLQEDNWANSNHSQRKLGSTGAGDQLGSITNSIKMSASQVSSTGCSSLPEANVDTSAEEGLEPRKSDKANFELTDRVHKVTEN